MKYFSDNNIKNTINSLTAKLFESTEMSIDNFIVKAYVNQAEIDNLIDNVINMVIKTYEPIGGYYGNTNVKRLKRTTSMIKAVYENNVMIACSFYRNIDGSYKIQAYGNNQNKNGKDATKAIIHSDVNEYKSWIWGEVSGGVEKYFKKFEGYPLPNEYVQEALNKPNDQLVLSKDGFHYKRNIGVNGEPNEKVVFGFKNKELFDKVCKEADYEMLRSEFNISSLNEKVENDFKITTFKGACSFVNQLSDLYDEKNLRQLTPGLSSMLDQSIEILKGNVTTESWVMRTLLDAEFLRDNISTITYVKNYL